MYASTMRLPGADRSQEGRTSLVAPGWLLQLGLSMQHHARGWGDCMDPPQPQLLMDKPRDHSKATGDPHHASGSGHLLE